ncbi:hypothetical protein [uncultured Clostridium sp.]|uniref:hypothetical protein n=1 Tax=uncultured Clostridium sp. TaxID=59620 RepID=UPI0026734DDB|nr:hypothetical protein [uncultured Clostridium sp.]
MNELKIKELVLKIMNSAIEKTFCTEHDVFVKFNAHIKALEIDIHKNGWKKRSERLEESIYKFIYLVAPFEEYKTEIPVLEELEKVLNYINEL